MANPRKNAEALLGPTNPELPSSFLRPIGPPNSSCSTVYIPYFSMTTFRDMSSQYTPPIAIAVWQSQKGNLLLNPNFDRTDTASCQDLCRFLCRKRILTRFRAFCKCLTRTSALARFLLVSGLAGLKVTNSNSPITTSKSRRIGRAPLPTATQL